MKKVIPKINFNKKDFTKILAKCVSCRRMLFIISFGILLIITFDIVYQYAFLNVRYIDYVEDDNFIITDGKINNANLSGVLRNVDGDKEKIRIGINKKYETPFEFDYEIYYYDDENIDDSDFNDSENSGDDESGENNF